MAAETNQKWIDRHRVNPSKLERLQVPGVGRVTARVYRLIEDRLGVTQRSALA